MTALLSQYSAIFGLAVEMYQRHIREQWGHCVCGQLRCPVKTNAADVIGAAGIDPTVVDTPPSISQMETMALPLLRLPKRAPGASLAKEADQGQPSADWWQRDR